MAVMESFYLFAGLMVRDRDTAVEWYERLLGGPPTMFPNDTEAVWDLAERQSIYLRQSPERAGNGEVTLFFDDPAALEETVSGVAGRGIEAESRETYDNGVRKVTFHDPDGNEVGFGSMPPDAG